VRAAVREALQNRKEIEARLELNERALGIVLEKNRFDLPPSALEALSDLHLAVLKDKAEKGYPLPEGDGTMEKTAEANARRELKTILLLREIARREGIKADPVRVAEAVAREARERGEDPALFRKKAENDGSIQSYQDRVLRDQALEFIIENAEVKSADEK